MLFLLHLGENMFSVVNKLATYFEVRRTPLERDLVTLPVSVSQAQQPLLQHRRDIHMETENRRIMAKVNAALQMK